MICGNPFDFALQFEVVDFWNVPGDVWKNGLFCLYIDGKRVVDVVDVVELKTTISFYANAFIDDLAITNIDINAADLYRNAESYFTGDGNNLIDGLFDLTCTAMEDNGFYLYFVKTGHGDRLIWSNNDGVDINDKILPKNTVRKAIQELLTKKI